MGQGAGVVLRVGCDLGEGDMAGFCNELAKGTIGDRRPVNPEPVDNHPMDRCFFGIVAVGTHAVFPAGNKGHVLRIPVEKGGFLRTVFVHCLASNCLNFPVVSGLTASDRT